MTNRRGLPVVRAAVTGLVFAAIWLGRPGVAEAQARGALQVTAQVVDIKASFDGLQAARAALQDAAAATSQGGVINTVSTLAQVSITQPASRSDLVVTIDYSKD